MMRKQMMNNEADKKIPEWFLELKEAYKNKSDQKRN